MNLKKYILCFTLLASILLAAGCSSKTNSAKTDNKAADVTKEAQQDLPDTAQTATPEAKPTEEPALVTESPDQAGLIETMKTDGYENLTVEEFNNKLSNYMEDYPDFGDEQYQIFLSGDEEKIDFCSTTLFYSFREIQRYDPIYLPSQWLTGNDVVSTRTYVTYDLSLVESMTVKERDTMFASINNEISDALNTAFKDYSLDQIKDAGFMTELDSVLTSVEQAKHEITFDLYSWGIEIYHDQKVNYQCILPAPVSDQVKQKYADYTYFDKDTTPLNICFIGNSLTYVPCIPETFEAMFTKDHPNIKVSSITAPGAKLSDLVSSCRSNEKNAELVKNADILILQEYGGELSDTFDMVQQFKDMAKDTCRLYFYETDIDCVLMRTDTAETYDYLHVIPVGSVMRMMEEQYLNFTYEELHKPGDYHPNEFYGYMAGYVFDRVLFGDSVSELLADNALSSGAGYIKGYETSDWALIGKVIEDVVSQRYNTK